MSPKLRNFGFDPKPGHVAEALGGPSSPLSLPTAQPSHRHWTNAFLSPEATSD